jgi:hypothetical protein
MPLFPPYLCKTYFLNLSPLLPISFMKGEAVGSLLVVHRKQAKEVISILMESCFYFDLSPQDRLGLIRALMVKMIYPD